MSDLKWQDPPATNGARAGRPNKWAAIVAALKERPGEWALVDVGNNGLASQLRCGRIGGVVKGEVEVTTRNMHAHPETGRIVTDIYARYVGPA